MEHSSALCTKTEKNIYTCKEWHCQMPSLPTFHFSSPFSYLLDVLTSCTTKATERTWSSNWENIQYLISHCISARLTTYCGASVQIPELEWRLLSQVPWDYELEMKKDIWQHEGEERETRRKCIGVKISAACEDCKPALPSVPWFFSM